MNEPPFSPTSSAALTAAGLPDVLSPPAPSQSLTADPMQHGHVPDGIFIVGCPRSGTTLLQTLLAAHPLITSFSESNFFASNFARLPRTAIYYLRTHPTKQVKDFLEQNLEVVRPYDDLLRQLDAARLYSPWSANSTAQIFFSLLDRWADRRDARIWLEKSPVHLWFLPLIERAAAHANISIKMIHIVRDGRDVVASLYRSSKQWGTTQYTLDYCVKRWNSDLTATIKRINDRSTDVLVSYEEIAAQPELAMKRLLSALSVPWDDHVLSDRQAAARQLPRSTGAHHQKLLMPIERSTTFERTFGSVEKTWIMERLNLTGWAELRKRCALPTCPRAE